MPPKAGLGSTHLRHRAQDLACRFVGDGNGLAAIGINPLAVDVTLLAKERRVADRQICAHDGVALLPDFIPP